MEHETPPTAAPANRANDERAEPDPANARAYQDGLFDGRRVIERRLANGTRVRMTLEPLARGRVRVERYERRPPNGVWREQPGESGRVVPFERLKLRVSFAELFGVHDPDVPTDRSCGGANGPRG